MYISIFKYILSNFINSLFIGKVAPGEPLFALNAPKWLPGTTLGGYSDMIRNKNINNSIKCQSIVFFFLKYGINKYEQHQLTFGDCCLLLLQ